MQVATASHKVAAVLQETGRSVIGSAFGTFPWQRPLPAAETSERGPVPQRGMPAGVLLLFLAGGQQRAGHGEKADAAGPSQGEHPEPTVISMVGMIENPRQQLDMLAPVATVERVIGNQHLHVGSASQRLKLLVDHPGNQQQKESPPIGMDRVEKPINRVLGHATCSIRHFQGAKEVPSGKNQDKQKTEHRYR